MDPLEEMGLTRNIRGSPPRPPVQPSPSLAAMNGTDPLEAMGLTRAGGQMLPEGQSPETAINAMPPDEDLPWRFNLKNLTTSPAQMVRELERRGFAAKDLGNEDIAIRSKQNGLWHKLDPSGWQGFKELGRDIADVAGGAMTLAGQGIGHAVGALGGFAAANVPGGIAGGIAGGAAGAGIADVIRTEIGGRLAGFAPDTGEALKSAGTESLYGLAGEALAPLAKPVLKGAAKVLKAPYAVEQKAADAAVTSLAKVGAAVKFGKNAGTWAKQGKISLDLAPTMVPGDQIIDPAGKISQVMKRSFSPTDVRRVRAADLRANPALMKSLQATDILGPDFMRGGFSGSMESRAAHIDQLFQKLSPAEQATLSQKVASLSPQFTKYFKGTVGPKGGLAEKIYGSFGRKIGPALVYSQLFGYPAGASMALGTAGGHLAGSAIEKLMAIGPTKLESLVAKAPAAIRGQLQIAFQAAKKGGLSAYYAALQLLLRNEDLRDYLEEKGTALREAIQSPS